jgi:hypothetical protein
MKGLLFFLSMGMIFITHGFNQNPTLAGLADNTAKDLGSYTAQCADSSGDPDYCRRYGDYSRFTYDSDHHQILFFGGGHSSTMRDDVDVFSFADLTWTGAYKSTQCSQMTSITNEGLWQSTGHPVARHTYDQLTYAPNVGRLIMTIGVYGAGYCGTYGGCGEWCGGKILFYDPEAKTWTAQNSGNNGAHVWADEYDPVSGRIISAGRQGLRSYDPVNDVKTAHQSSSVISGYANNMVYFPPNDKFYYFGRGTPTAVWEITPNRSNWNASTVVPVTGMSGSPGSQETGWAYDTVNHIIGGAIRDGKFYAYNPLTKAWTAMTMQGDAVSSTTCYSHCIDYDPVDNVFIFYARDYHTYAYKYKNGNSQVDKGGGAVLGDDVLSVSPNPFNSNVKIMIRRYAYGVWRVSSQIYNISGKLVKDFTPYASRITPYAFTWNASQHPCGIYIASLKIGNKTYQKPLYLIK